MHSISVKHNFEAAHRLPHLGGKCKNLHGHSWWAEVWVSCPNLTQDFTVVEFGAFKGAMRRWIDTYLDHGAMLGMADPLLPAFRADGTKVYVFGEDWPQAQWPTVEAVAALIADQARDWLADADEDAPPGSYISQVRVSETSVNTAEWQAPAYPPMPTIGQLWHKQRNIA